MGAEAEFYSTRDTLLAELVAAKAAFAEERTASTKERLDAAANAYARFRSGVRALAYLSHPEGSGYRVDAERMIARGDYQEA